MNKHIKLIFGACAVICNTLLADDNTYDLGIINVTSTAENTQVDADKISVKKAGMVRDIMRDIPGVYVGGTNDLNQRIYMRGSNDYGLNITIDGARQDGNVYHHAADMLMDLDLIKSISVSPGVRSIIGNSGAMGGSVAFKTVDASDMLESGQVFGGKAKFGYSENSKEFKESLMLYGRAYDSLDILGYFSNADHDYAKSAKRDKIGGDGKKQSFLIKTGLDFADFNNIKFGIERAKYTGIYPSEPEYSVKKNVYDHTYTRDTYTANYTSNPNDYVDLLLNAYYTDKHFVNNTLDSASQKTRNVGIKQIGTKLQNKTILGGDNFSQTLIYGGEYFINTSYDGYEAKPDDKAKSLSFFIEDQFKIADLTITPGIRYDHYSYYTGIAQDEFGEFSWHAFSPALAINYDFNENISTYASYAKLFKGPEPAEAVAINSRPYLSVNSEGIEPTKGDAYEIGGKFQTQISDNSNFKFDAKFFYTDYSNLVTEVYRDGLERVNAGNASVHGVELQTKYNIDTLSLLFGYSRTRTHYKDETANMMSSSRNGNTYQLNAYHNILAYSDMGDKYTFSAEYFITPIDLLIGYNMIAFNKITTQNSQKLTSFKKPGYATHDIYASWTPENGILKGLEINAGIYNLFNKYYWSHSLRNAGNTSGSFDPDWEPGRSFRASVSYKF